MVPELGFDPSAIQSLRPLRLSELLDQAIRLYRRNFLTYIGILALVLVPTNLLTLLVSLPMMSQLANSGETPGGDLFPVIISLEYLLTILLGLINFILIQVLATSAMTRFSIERRLGLSSGILEAYRRSRPAWLRIFLSILAVGLATLAVLIWSIVPCIGWLGGPGMLLFLLGVIARILPAIILTEGCDVLASLRRAWDLARRRFWWLVGFAVVVIFFGQLVVSGPTLVVTIIMQAAIGSPVASSMEQLTLQQVINTLVGIVTQLLYTPLSVILFSLVYLDLRVRTEGLDLALQAASGAPQPIPPMEVLTQAPPPEDSRLVTPKELGYFSLLALSVIGLYLVIFVGFGILSFLVFSSAGT